MNIQTILASLSNPTADTQADPSQASPATAQSSILQGLGSILPGGLAGGAAAGGVMALLMGSKSTRKMATKVAKLGGTAVLGGLAYKAYGNWQQNKSLNQTQPISDVDIHQAKAALSSQANEPRSSLDMILIASMIAASKSDGEIDSQEHQRLFEAIGKLNLGPAEKAAVFDMMSQDITVQEIADAVSSDEHKAEVYLSAYLAIEVDEQSERTFLNNLAIALQLPKGFPAYLEQQADQGVVV